MKSVPIVKYTSYGNNFVILDETRDIVLTESEKPLFAHPATNMNFGVGSDNFLVVQRCTTETLREINAVRNYWTELPDPMAADYIFRMFEPDGVEAYSCGNGLMSVADYLSRHYGVDSARMLTEIPTFQPKVVSIGTDPKNESNWANMVDPRKMPDEMVDHSIKESINGNMDFVKDLPINKFRRSDQMRFFSDNGAIAVSGYLVFTGEPHFVVFVDTGFSAKDVGNHFFISTHNKEQSSKKAEKRTSTSTALVDFIGNYFVREYSDIFPVGININFVRLINDSKILEYRCFERGVNHETLACGTGALAVAFVARELQMVDGKNLTVWPHRCRWEVPDAEIKVKKNADGWLLNGNPSMLMKGTFMWG